MLQSLHNLGQVAYFGYRCFVVACQSFLSPMAVLKQVYVILIGALSLGTVTGMALGAVVWMHSHTVLARTGMSDYLPTVLAAAVLMELAPIGAGLIVAARSGASLGAELGAMKVSEQIDALEMLGVPTMRWLVGPRVLACMIALPFLHIYISALAIGSGFLAENLLGQTTMLKYQSAAMEELYLSDVLPAAIKTIAFGFVIAVAGCYHGLRADGGTEGVGVAATRGVVSAALWVLAADVVIVGVIQLVQILV